MDVERLQDLLAAFSRLRVLVLGDFFLDKYLELERTLSEVSLETGLEAYQVTATRPAPGAAGTVVANLCALGVQVAVLGVIGDTGEGYELQRAFHSLGVDLTHLLVRSDLLTPTYTKPMMREPDGSVHELQRLDIKNRRPLPRDAEEELLRRLQMAVPQANVVLISEYVQERNCGAITDRVRQEVARLGTQRPGTVFIADSRTRIGEYRGVALKINRSETLRAFQLAEDAALAVIGKAAAQRARQNSRPVFVTLGEDGILACDRTGWEHVPTVRAEGPIDPVGAGDSVIAGIACALAVGASKAEAALLGNLAAAVTVRKIGTTGTASPEEILERFGVWQKQQRADAS